MATYEQRDNSGSIFKNDKKGNDKAPDYRGKGMVNGTEVEIALWVKKSTSGVSYFSASFKEPYKGNTHVGVDPEPKGINAEKDDLPF